MASAGATAAAKPVCALTGLGSGAAQGVTKRFGRPGNGRRKPYTAASSRERWLGRAATAARLFFMPALGATQSAAGAPADYRGDVDRNDARARRLDPPGDRPTRRRWSARVRRPQAAPGARAGRGAAAPFAAALAQAAGAGYGRSPRRAPPRRRRHGARGRHSPAIALHGSRARCRARCRGAPVGGSSRRADRRGGRKPDRAGRAAAGIERIAGDRRLPQRHGGGGAGRAVVRVLRLVGGAAGRRADRRRRRRPRLGLGDLVVGAGQRARGPERARGSCPSRAI